MAAAKVRSVDTIAGPYISQLHLNKTAPAAFILLRAFEDGARKS